MQADHGVDIVDRAVNFSYLPDGVLICRKFLPIADGRSMEFLSEVVEARHSAPAVPYDVDNRKIDDFPVRPFEPL